MTNLDFEDLVPRKEDLEVPGQQQETPALSFTDLVPTNSPPASAPTGGVGQQPPQPQLTPSLSFDDLVPQSAPLDGGNVSSPLGTAARQVLDVVTPDFLRPVQRGANRALAGGAVAAADVGLVEPDTAAGIVGRTQEFAEQFPPSDEALRQLAEVENLQGVGDTLAWIVNNPEGVGTLLGESIGTSLGGIVTGAGAGLGGLAVAGPPGGTAGLVGGTALGSGATEYVVTFEEVLRERGFDIADEKQLTNALANEELMAEVRTRAVGRGVVIGLVDGLTTFLGVRGFGKLVTDSGVDLINRIAGRELVEETGESIGKLTAEGLANTAIEATGGGVGEAGAQFVTTGEVRIPDVVLEAALEVGPGSIDATLATSFRAFGNGDRTQAFIEAATAAGVDPFTTELQTADEAELAGRRFFGFAEEGEQIVQVTTDSSTAEQVQGSGDARRGTLIAASDSEVTLSADDFVGEAVSSTVLDDRVSFVGEDSGAAQEKLAQALAAPDPQTMRTAYLEAVDLGARIEPREDATTAMFVGDPTTAQVLPRPVDLGGPVSSFEPVAEGVSDAQLFPRQAPLITREVVDFRRLEQNLPGAFVPNSETLAALIDLPEFAAPRAELVAFNDQELARDIETRTARTVFDELGPQGFLELFQQGKISVKADSRFGDRFALLGDDAVVKAGFDASVVQGPKQIGRRKASLNTFRSLVGPGLEFGPDVTTVSEGLGVVDETTLIDPKTLQAGVKLIEELKKRFGIRDQIGLIFGLEGKLNHFIDTRTTLGARGELGSYIASGQDHVIFVRDTPNSTEFITTLAHEFGHLLSNHAYSKADVATRGLIEAAYLRFIENVPGKDGKNEAFARRRESISSGQPSLSPITANQGYFYSFEEWFAEQVARWSTTNRRTVGLLSNFYRGLAKQILLTLKRFRQLLPGESFRPEPEMEAWLDALHRGETQANWAQNARTALDEQTRQANAKHLGPAAVPMQPESAPIYQVLDKFNVPGVDSGSIKAHVDRYNWLYKYFLNFRQVAERNAHIPQLNEYRTLVESAQLDANRIMAEAETMLRQWRQLREVKKGQPESVRLTRFLKELNAMVYLTPQEEARGIRRWPTQAELQRLTRKHGLSQQGLDMYVKIRDMFLQSLQRVEGLAVQNANRNLTDPAARAKAIAEARNLTRQSAASPYFPMLRFGEFALRVVNPSGATEAFVMRETKRERSAVLKDLEAQFPAAQGFKIIRTTVPRDAAHFANVPPWLLGKLKGLPGITRDQQRWIDDFRAELAPSRSFLKRTLRQKGVTGESRLAR